MTKHNELAYKIADPLKEMTIDDYKLEFKKQMEV